VKLSPHSPGSFFLQRRDEPLVSGFARDRQFLGVTRDLP
jgi:hypothetical protein